MIRDCQPPTDLPTAADVGPGFFLGGEPTQIIILGNGGPGGPRK